MPRNIPFKGSKKLGEEFDPDITGDGDYDLGDYQSEMDIDYQGQDKVEGSGYDKVANQAQVDLVHKQQVDYKVKKVLATLILYVKLALVNQNL